MNAICTMGAADAALSLPGADTARDLAATSISPNTKRAYLRRRPRRSRGMAGRLRPRRWHAGGDRRLTGHSGRVGLASELTARGASTADVMLAGGWKTARMVAHYGRQ